MASSLFIFALTFIVIYLLLLKVKGKRQRSGYIRQFQFSSGLYTKFKLKHPTLTDLQVERVMQGLRDYFLICNQASPRQVAMPSQVVDDAWHEFILFTKDYHRFCQRAFGRYLHHTPAEAMRNRNNPQPSIRRTWRLACLLEKINPHAPTALPLLFALDAELAIVNGFSYSLHCLPGSNHYCADEIGCSAASNADSCSADTSSGCSSDDGCSGSCGGGD